MSDNGKSQVLKLPTERSQQLIQEIIDSLNIEEYDTIVTQGSQKGDNYLSDIFRIKITRKSGDPLNLIMKIALPDMEMRSHASMNKIFNREIFVYAEMLPTLIQFQEDCGLREEDRFSFTKLYKGCGEEMNEMLIMEDLSVKGFRMYDRHNSYDYDHARLCIETLARTHACMIVLKDKNPSFYQTVEKHSSSMSEFRLMEPFCEKSKPVIQELCQGEPYYDRMMKLSENMYEKLETFMKPDTVAPYSIMCHGDCWCNNFLFQYEGEKVVDMRMLDWQIIREASPVTDIAYMLLLGSDKQLRAKHHHELLDIYYETLSKNVTKMGVNIDKYYPEHIYREHLKKCMHYGLILAVIVLPFVLGDKGEAVDITEIGDGEKPISINDRTRIRLKDVIEDCIEYGYI